MKVHLHRLKLPLEFQFTIARGSISTQDSLIVELEHDGQSGFGESTANRHYSRTLDSMSESILSCRQLIESFDFGQPEDLWKQLHTVISSDPFAMNAVDLAAYDLFGKLTGKRTHEVLGLEWSNIPSSSYTVGIDSIDKMIAKLQARSDWSIYKIKVGTDHDVEIIRALREVTDATFRVDANCGWTPDETVANSHELKNLGVEFIEQPLPADASTEDQKRAYTESALPLIADESCLVESDVTQCAGRFHGVNVKLCKCGGLTPAVRMLREARNLGMNTMIGCMVESSVGISGAAQLLPLLDYADLDGAALLSQDPATGVHITNGHAKLSNEFGSGIQFHPAPELLN